MDRTIFNTNIKVPSFRRACRLSLPVPLLITGVLGLVIVMANLPYLTLDITGMKEAHYIEHGVELPIYDEYDVGIVGYMANNKSSSEPPVSQGYGAFPP